MKLNPDPKWFAASLANAHDGEQAEFFNEFARTLYMVCKRDMDMQICYMVDKLNNAGIDLMKIMYDFTLTRKEADK